MSENVKSLTLKGLYWNAIDRFGNQFVTTLVGVLLARLLDVGDFAVIAVLAIFTTISTSFVDSGLATSLVRTKEVEAGDYSTMFVFNLFASIGIYMILFLSAPYIERYYDIPNLATYARVLFLQIVIVAFGKIQYVSLLKESRFNVTAKVNVLSVFLSGVLALGMTFWDMGVWVLVCLPVFTSFFSTLLYWVWGVWKVDVTFSWGILKKHTAFSVSFMFSNLMGRVLSPVYNNFIGKLFDPIQTGFYFQANKWGETPNLLLSSIIQGTTLSTLTPIQDDAPRYLNACRKTMSTLGFVLFPVSLMMVSLAEAGFVTVLTDKYRDAVPYFQLLCVGGIFMSLTDLNVNFINIKGQSRFALRLEIVKITSAVMLLFLTYDKGMIYIIIGQLAVRLLCYGISTVYSTKTYHYSFPKQISDLLSPFLMAVIAAAISYMPNYYGWFNNMLLLLVVQGILFVLIYVILSHITRNMIWLDILKLMRSKLNFNGKNVKR